MSTDWRNMEAGRELDRLIAERVVALGYTESHLTLAFVPTHPDDIPSIDNPPRYSTDLNAAFVLLAPGEYHFTHPNLVDWGCKFGKQEYFGWHYADTPALAICRAWLEWQDSKQAEDGQ